jgi:hypothetical protein
VIAGLVQRTYVYARQAATDDELELHRTKRKELVGFVQLDGKKQPAH